LRCNVWRSGLFRLGADAPSSAHIPAMAKAAITSAASSRQRRLFRAQPAWTVERLVSAIRLSERAIGAGAGADVALGMRCLRNRRGIIRCRVARRDATVTPRQGEWRTEYEKCNYSESNKENDAFNQFAIQFDASHPSEAWPIS